ncbi:hypothetical protein TNCV_2450811 [Trichonephila clavipes]|nr:hypothetical protein TNCV_2450811 [Trichonephila clavipes]
MEEWTADGAAIPYPVDERHVSKVYVGGSEKIHLVLDTIKAKPGFWRLAGLPEKENAIEKESRFQGLDEIMQSAMAELNIIPKEAF